MAEPAGGDPGGHRGDGSGFIVKAWPNVPADVRAAVLGLVRPFCG